MAVYQDMLYPAQHYLTWGVYECLCLKVSMFLVCRFLSLWMCTIMCIWAISSSCDRKMRRLENVPWESEKMQEASKKVWKVSNWEAESYGLLEGTQRRSFPNSSDERVGAIDESRLTLIRLSWHWDDSASSPPPPSSFRSTPPNDYRCSLHFSQSHRSVSLLRIPSLPPSRCVSSS